MEIGFRSYASIAQMEHDSTCTRVCMYLNLNVTPFTLHCLLLLRVFQPPGQIFRGRVGLPKEGEGKKDPLCMWSSVAQHRICLPESDKGQISGYLQVLSMLGKWATTFAFLPDIEILACL